MRGSVAGISLVSVVCLVAGCGGGQSDALQKRVNALQDELTVLQGAVDRLEEQLAARDAAAAPREARSEPPAPATAPQRPRLQIVKVQPGSPDVDDGPAPAAEPEPAPPEGEAAPDAPRPVIRGTGDRIETELPRGSTSREDGRADPPPAGQDRGGRGT